MMYHKDKSYDQETQLFVGLKDCPRQTNTTYFCQSLQSVQLQDLVNDYSGKLPGPNDSICVKKPCCIYQY